MHKTRPLCGKGHSLGVDMASLSLYCGKAPTFDMYLQDKYGVHWNQEIRMVISKDFRFMTVIFIEKYVFIARRFDKGLQ